jgi:hypothetical protein
MNIESMPPVIQRALKGLLQDASVNLTMREGLVRTDAIIARLDELNYWEHPNQTYREKYDAVAKYLFTAEELAEEDAPQAPHLPPDLARIKAEAELERIVSALVGNRTVVVFESMPSGSYPDAEEFEHEH